MKAYLINSQARTVTETDYNGAISSRSRVIHSHSPAMALCSAVMTKASQ